MPHKTAAHAYCSASSPTSRLLGVVSVMRRNADGSWHGDMLDGMAFVKAQVNAGAKLQGARVLLLGAGGAGSAIAVAMLDHGLRELIIHDRNPAQAEKLVQTLSDIDDRVAVGSPDPRGFDVICNATPMGMAAGDPLPISTDLLEANAFVGDVISGHGETPLLQAARARGLRTADGDQMVEAVQSMMLAFLLGGARLG
jgi:shikimate dehydrogenase